VSRTGCELLRAQWIYPSVVLLVQNFNISSNQQGHPLLNKTEINRNNAPDSPAYAQSFPFEDHKQTGTVRLVNLETRTRASANIIFHSVAFHASSNALSKGELNLWSVAMFQLLLFLVTLGPRLIIYMPLPCHGLFKDDMGLCCSCSR
jgi:hypothetical protein